MKKILYLFIVLFFIGCDGTDTIKKGDKNMPEPIPTYQNYFYDESKKLYGIDSDPYNRLVLIPLLNSQGKTIPLTDFFSKDGALYFTVTIQVQSVDENDDPIVDEFGNPVMEDKILYYKQENGKLTNEVSVPARPAQGRKQLNNSEFTIINNTYDGQDVSDLRNIAIGSGIERFLLLNAYSYFPGECLFFYVKEGREPVRPDESLYVWHIDKPSVQRIAEKGEIW